MLSELKWWPKYNTYSLSLPRLYSSLCKACCFKDHFQELTPLDLDLVQEAHRASATVGFENFPGPNPKVPPSAQWTQWAASMFVLFWWYYPFSTERMLLLECASHSASSLVTPAALEQPKPQECQGDYWPMSNLLWAEVLKSRRQIYLSYRLNRLNKSALPAQGALHSHQASSIIKKAHVFKINCFSQ